jgi:alkanesulfonate monooxygenase SsuD/methylene tetrahydromethanopterin reductase-like flavin-dependent oxidoreductase (luciferase family)
VHPFRTDIPIYLGAEGPKNVSLAGEIADGWLPLFFSPKEDAWYRERLRTGFDAAGDPAKADRFEVASMLTIIPGDDVEECADLVRPFVALYAGGMGAKGANFHFDVFDRMGWGGVATKIQELYLEGKKQEAAALIPLEMVEDVALVGPPDKIRDEMAKWKDTCLTTVLLTGQANQLERLADLVNG